MLPGELGNLEIALGGTNADMFELGTLGSTQLTDVAPTMTFTVRPKTGLVAGTYTATVTLRADYDLTLNLNVSFKVATPGSSQPGGSGSDGGSGSSGGASTVPNVPAATETGVNVVVNGQAESMGSATTEEVNGRKVTTVTIQEFHATKLNIILFRNSGLIHYYLR